MLANTTPGYLSERKTNNLTIPLPSSVRPKAKSMTNISDVKHPDSTRKLKTGYELCTNIAQFKKKKKKHLHFWAFQITQITEDMYALNTVCFKNSFTGPLSNKESEEIFYTIKKN